MAPRLQPAPPRVCDPHGQPHIGTYRGLIPDTGLAELAPAFELVGLARIAAEKRWHYVCLCHPRWICGLGIVRLGYGAAAFTSLFDRERDTFAVQRSQLAPPLVAARIADRPGDGAESTFRLPGFHASLLGPPGLDRYELRIRLSGEPAPFDLAAEIDRAAGPDALSAICPLPGRGTIHTTAKQVGLPARGRLLLGEQRFELDADCFALIDYSHGLLDRTTSWMWSSAGGRTPRGRVVGWNLTAGFTEGAENAVWVGSDLLPLGPVTFRRQTDGPDSPWLLRDGDERIELRFQPAGLHRQRRDLGPLSTNILQALGTFSGRLTDRRGRPVKIERLCGLCEEHHSRW